MTEPVQQPSVGRIVHIVTVVPDPDEAWNPFDPTAGSTVPPADPPAKVCTAAIITGVQDDGAVSLHAFAAPPWTVDARPSSPVPVAAHEELADQIEPGPVGHTVGTWHWPERVS